MEIRRDDRATGPLIAGFAGTGYRIRLETEERVFAGGALVTPLDAQAWNAPDPAALTMAALGDLLALDRTPEFLLLGTGATLVQPSRAFVNAMEARGIGVEVMDSRAAARAWNVLRHEGRWIIAALMPL